MKAIIMIGGYATRLQPISLRTPKCLLPIGGKSNLERIIEGLVKAGVKDVIISLNSTQKKVMDFLGNGDKFGVNITYVKEVTTEDSNKLGAVGGLKYVIDKVGSDDYLVIGGDNFFDGLDVKEFLEAHKKSGKLVTLALYELPDKNLVSQTGIAVVKNKRIIEFQEKPSINEAKSQLSSIMFYAINKEFFEKHLEEYIDYKKGRNEKADNIGEMWQYFVDKIYLNVFEFKGMWWDIGTPENYIKVNEHALKIFNQLPFYPNITMIPPVLIDKDVVIKKNSVIGPNVQLMKGVIVGNDCIIKNSIIFENVEIGSRSEVSDAVIDADCVVKKNSKIEKSIIGYKSEANNKLIKNSRIWPFVKTKNNIIEDSVLRNDLLGIEQEEIMSSKYWE